MAGRLGPDLNARNCQKAKPGGCRASTYSPTSSLTDVSRGGPFTSFAGGKAAAAVVHEVEGFAESDEAILQNLGGGEVDVVVAGAVDDEEITGKPLREVDSGAALVAVSVGRGQAHVALLVDGVVALLVGHRSGGDAGGVEAGVAEHHVERVGAAAAPSPHGH